MARCQRKCEHIVRDALASIPADNRRLRVQHAMYLIATSPQYQVQRYKEGALNWRPSAAQARTEHS